MDFKNFGKNLSSLGAQISPFASRTFQYTKEQLGQAEDKTQLPPDYIDLEKRVDALKQAHQKMLAVTSQYSNEPYDYPPNIKETFQDLGRTVSEKVTLLSSASSPAEAQAALTAPPSAKPQPKTFSHALARSSYASSQILHQNHTGAGEDPLATALEKYAIASERVGEARLAQDAQIQSRFLAGWNTTLNTNIMFAVRARKNVERARLTLDASKAHVKGTTWKMANPSSPRTGHPDETELSPEAQEEIEKAEDEFVTQTEEAVGVMKNVLDSPEPLRNLAELIPAGARKKIGEMSSLPAAHPDGDAFQSLAQHRRASGKISSGLSDRSQSPISRTGTPGFPHPSNIAPQHMFEQALNGDAFHSPSLPSFGFRHPSPGAMSISNGSHLEAPPPYDTLAAQNTALKTRVSELEVINDLFRGRVTELETSEQAARGRESQLRTELEEVKAREADLKRRLDELEGQSPRHKKMRLSDLVDESRAGSPINELTE